MANFNVDAGAETWEIVNTLNYLLSNLGNTPYGLTINKTNGEILNVGTNTVTGYLYRYINIAWANNVQGLYFSSTSANQTFYGVQNNDSPTYPTASAAFTWTAIPTPPGAIGPTNGVKLWYSIGGGRTISFAFGTTMPGPGYVEFVDGIAIDLDTITFIGNSSVIGDYWSAGSHGYIGANLTIAGLVTDSVLNADTVGTTQLVDFSVTNVKLGNNSVTSGKIANFTIVDNDIANLTITGSKVVDYTLDGTKLANATVTTQQVQDYSLLGTDLANLTVTGQQVADYTLVGTKLANLTVDTDQLTDLSVTNAKLASNAVTSGKIANFTIVDNDIANLTITGSKVVSNTITADKLSVTTLSSITANAGTITSGTIEGASVGGATLITGYTAGATPTIANVGLTNGSATVVGTFSVSTPVATRVVIELTGTANLFGNEANVSYYNGMTGTTVVDVLYSNSTVRSTFTTFAQGSPTIQRVSGTSYNYRMYIPTNVSQSLLLVPDTYSIRVNPTWTYRDNTTGNVVTATNEVLTYQGRLATFQANIS